MEKVMKTRRQGDKETRKDQDVVKRIMITGI